MKYFFLLILSSILFLCCREGDNPAEVFEKIITAKEKSADVINTAKSSFAADAELSAIYGWNVSSRGEVDLTRPNDNAFVYVVQSDSKQSNEFYVPVYAAGPIKSPIDFSTILFAIKDSTAKGLIGKALNQLSKISISENTNWVDSPEVLSTGNTNGGIDFLNSNSNVKIDLLLLPSLQLINSNLSASTAWIVNYYTSSKSLVLLIDGSNANFITKISD